MEGIRLRTRNMKKFMNFRYFTAGLLLTLLQACVTAPGSQVSWPAELPPLQYYENYYSHDEGNQLVQTQDDYLKWVKRYYQGWAFYSEGWEWLTAKVLSEVEDYPQRIRLKVKMASIGRRISAEWAKNTDHRAINSQNLLVWRDAVKVSVKRGEEENLADKISYDVDQLLAGLIPPNAIELDNYFPDAEKTIAEDDFAMDDDF